MNLKKFPLVLALLAILLSSCKNSESSDEENSNNDTINIQGESREQNVPDSQRSASEGEDHKDSNINPPKTEGPDGSSNPDQSVSNTTGTYIKIGEESDNNCHCYCLDLNPSDNSEFCLVPGEIYITGRLQKNSDNSFDLYLVGPSARNTQGKDMPWNDFDRNSAIAKIVPKANGDVDFDWLGFKINGDLAMDYAIFGKKTLEGQYKMK